MRAQVTIFWSQLARQLTKSYETQRIYVKLRGEQYANTYFEYPPEPHGPATLKNRSNGTESHHNENEETATKQMKSYDAMHARKCTERY